MSTRQTRNSRLGGLAIPLLSLILSAYFAYHAWSGRYGIESMRRLDAEAVRLEFELAAVRASRETVERKVMLLRDGTIERDMLDEQARNALNLVHKDEIVILRNPLN